MITYYNLGNAGRLGNQMFQIASTIGIARSNNIDYFFPKWGYSKYFINELPELIITENNNKIYNIQEPHFNYYPFNIQNKEINYNLSGYFQSEKYFINVKDEIVKYFTLKNEYEELILSKYGHILSNSCSIHIRRGDYLTLPDHHPSISLEYVYNSVKILYSENELNDVNFLIFSDDIEWCKNNVKLPNTHFISGNDDIIDLFLMSKCNNNIIANSSFSWWAAWLNKNEEKKIIAPKKWFGPAIQHNTIDLTPESWILN